MRTPGTHLANLPTYALNAISLILSITVITGGLLALFIVGLYAYFGGFILGIIVTAALVPYTPTRLSPFLLIGYIIFGVAWTAQGQSALNGHRPLPLVPLITGIADRLT